MRHVGQGYLPAQLYNLSSCYGNKEQLQSLTWTLNHVGIKPIADIVINHRCADVQNANGIWNSYRDDVHHYGRRIDWGDWAVCRDDWHFGGTGALKTGASYHPAPDLDHTNEELRAALKDWLQWLRHEMGFMGWRFDFVKGYAPKYVKEYIDAVSLGEALHLGEFWVDMRWFGNTLDYDQDAPRQVLCDWISASGTGAAAFDFPTKGILQEAVKYTQYDRLRDRDGRAPGLLGWWPQKACTFIDNHDTGSTQKHWPFPESHLGLGYAYILTHPGVPCIAWEHMWDTRLTFIIKHLMRLRKRQDIHAGSKLEILCADRTMYVARIDDRVVVKLGPQQNMGIMLPTSEQGWRLSLAGHDFAVWEKSATELPSGTSGDEPASGNAVSSEPNP
ncbi:Alpha-amylase A type-1/2 [Trebouxia sp. C0010 RCD-2024]